MGNRVAEMIANRSLQILNRAAGVEAEALVVALARWLGRWLWKRGCFAHRMLLVVSGKLRVGNLEPPFPWDKAHFEDIQKHWVLS